MLLGGTYGAVYQYTRCPVVTGVFKGPERCPWAVWVLSAGPGQSWVLSGVPGQSWVLSGVPGLSWVLSGVPGFEQCPRTVFRGVLGDVPGQSVVLQGVPGHLGVLSGVPLHSETSSGVLGHSRVRVAGHKTFFFRATLGTQGG